MRAPGSARSRLRDRACRPTSRAALDPLRRAVRTDLLRTAMCRRPATRSSNTRRGLVPGQQWYSSVRQNPTPRERSITCPDAPGGPVRDHCGGHVSRESRERSGNSRRHCFAAVDHRSSCDRKVDVRDDENLGPAAMTAAGFRWAVRTPHGSARTACVRTDGRATARHRLASFRSAGRCTATHRTPALRFATFASAAETGGSRTRGRRHTTRSSASVADDVRRSR